MTVAVIETRAAVGVEAPAVSVEVHIASGLPSFSMVGLPESTAREARDRVRSALQNAGFPFPAGRVTVNLAPADLPKSGARFDLAVAVGVLVAAGHLPHPGPTELLGELALSGELRPVRSSLSAAGAARTDGRSLVVPVGNGPEAALVHAGGVLEAPTLSGVCDWLLGRRDLPRATAPPPETGVSGAPDLADVVGQASARRALEVAAAGGHHLLFRGPPGTGKSMLAERLPGLLPPLEEEAATRVAAVRSACGEPLDARTWNARPFRAPDSSLLSRAGLLGGGGGGAQPGPGEVTRASEGVLFLDEFNEMPRGVREALREPLQRGHVTISKARWQVTWPARFQLVAAMNPCPCGEQGDAGGGCHCTDDQISRYRNRVSGPLMDRFDLGVEVPRLTGAELTELCGGDGPRPERSSVVRERVAAARAWRLERSGALSCELTGAALEAAARLDSSGTTVLAGLVSEWRLSPRGHQKLLRVARTLADLEGRESISDRDLREAAQYRRVLAARDPRME